MGFLVFYERSSLGKLFDYKAWGSGTLSHLGGVVKFDNEEWENL